MKKIILGFLCAALLLSPAPKANAIIVFDPTNLVQNTLDVVENTISAIANPTTALQQTLDTVNKTVLIPMRDALTLVQIMQNSKNITALITGSLGGNALLVANPELYLKNTGLAVTQGGIDAIAGQNSIFGNSIIASIVKNTKSNSSSLTFQLANINKSNIPNIQQANTCNDASLSALARADASATGVDYNTRKTQLYNSLCACDPNANTADGKACSQRLATAANRSPSLDTFYAITQGDNAYVKAQLSQQAIDRDAANKKALAQADLNQGGGVKSKTTCTKTASNGGCIEKTIDQAGSILNKAYDQALSSGLNSAISSIGSGAGSLIGTLFTTINLVSGINTAIGGISGSSGGGSGNTTNRQTTVSVSTTNSTNTTTSGYRQDLVNNAQTKAILSATPMDQLNYHKNALQTLKTTDTSFISAIDGWNARLDTLGACFDNLTQLYPDETAAGTSYGTRVAAGKSYVSNTKNTNNNLKTTLQAELGKIDTAITLVNSTISTIQTSNSTDEITSAFQSYQNQIKTQGLPDLTSAIGRQSESVRFTGDVQISTMDGGTYFNFNADCTQIGSQIQFQRNGTGGGA